MSVLGTLDQMEKNKFNTHRTVGSRIYVRAWKSGSKQTCPFKDSVGLPDRLWDPETEPGRPTGEKTCRLGVIYSSFYGSKRVFLKIGVPLVEGKQK